VRARGAREFEQVHQRGQPGLLRLMVRRMLVRRCLCSKNGIAFASTHGFVSCLIISAGTVGHVGRPAHYVKTFMSLHTTPINPTVLSHNPALLRTTAPSSFAPLDATAAVSCTPPVNTNQVQHVIIRHHQNTAHSQPYARKSCCMLSSKLTLLRENTVTNSSSQTYSSRIAWFSSAYSLQKLRRTISR
jgi:hypothetical protein